MISNEPWKLEPKLERRIVTEGGRKTRGESENVQVVAEGGIAVDVIIILNGGSADDRL